MGVVHINIKATPTECNSHVQLLSVTSSGAIGVIGAFFGAGTGESLATNVNCAGNETTITACPYQSRLESVLCSHNDDAGVICPPGKIEIIIIPLQKYTVEPLE